MKIISIPKLLILSSLILMLIGIAFASEIPVISDEEASKLPGMPKVDIMTGDDRWGCEVLLCLANPNGPKAVAECHSPINKLYQCLSAIHPCKFPQCPMAGAGNYATQLNDGFDPCSLSKMEDAPVGYIVEGQLNDPKLFDNNKRNNQKFLKRGVLSKYNWGGEKFFSSNEEGSSGYWGGTKACVKGYQGRAYEPYTCTESSGDSSYTTTCYRPVMVYEQVLWQKYQSRRAIDVFIDGKNWTRVHW